MGGTDTRFGDIEQGQEKEDIVLDGLVRQTTGNVRIVKSGTNWRSLSLVKIAIERS